MITDNAVETVTAVLEERGWERDDELVQDVRAALEAVQTQLVTAAMAEERRRLGRERAQRDGRARAAGALAACSPEARSS